MFLSLLAGTLLALVIPDKPFPERLVNDFAGVFTSAQRDSLENTLTDFDNSTSNQISVITVKDLAGMDVAQFALRLGNKWGVGSSKNNGIIILLKPRGTDSYVDVTIQVGRGLEGAIPDAYASRIIRNKMGPLLKEDRYYAAVTTACGDLIALAKGEIDEPRDDCGDDDSGAIALIALITLIIVICILLALFGRKGPNDRNDSDGSSGGGGQRMIFIPRGGTSGGRSFGGGFGGFRGFGGGSFGGGGASGRF